MPVISNAPLPTLHLTVQSTLTPDRYRLVAEWCPPGEPIVNREREFEFHGGATNEALLEATLNPASYGKVLGQLLFVEGIRELYVLAKQGARVLLSVEAPKLQCLHWEQLCGPFDGNHWRLLGQDLNTLFSQYLPSATDRRFPPFGPRDLKALVVVCSPESNCSFQIAPFDEQLAVKTVLDGLGPIPSVVLCHQKDHTRLPSLKEIVKRLGSERFTLLHLVCHGRHSTQDEPLLFLDDGTENGRVEAVTATRLFEHLRGLGSSPGLPHLAFLAVCESAKPEEAGALSGLGQRLVRELGIPAVVAMTGRVSQQTALALGRAFYHRLLEHSEPDRALAESCAELRDRPDSTVPALFTRLGGQPLFANDSVHAPTFEEQVKACELLTHLFAERAPVLSDRVHELVDKVTNDPLVLTEPVLKEREAAVRELESLCTGALELTFSALSMGKVPPKYSVVCPFPGLAAFEAEQQHFFFGRELLVEHLQKRLQEQSLLVVAGNSGCGKSSLVAAGLLPSLTKVNPTLQLAQFPPGEHPLVRLEDSCRRLDPAHPRLVFVDQAEETFTLCADPVERAKFFDRLLELAKEGWIVVLTLRADFLGYIASHKGIRQALGQGTEYVDPLGPEELRAIAERQAQVAGLVFETGLSELILRDLADEPGCMPLLQHALLELYERRHGRWLRLDEYKKVGGVKEAITRTAERVWSSLDHENRIRMATLFKKLTHVRAQQDDGTIRDTRQRIALQKLPFGEDEAAWRQLVHRLANENLLVTSRDKHTEEEQVEVSHEALIRHWPRLRAWIDDNRFALHLSQELEESARAWRDSGAVLDERQKDFLVHRGVKGEQVRESQRKAAIELNHYQQEYFTACEVEEQRLTQEKEDQRRKELEAAQKLAAEQQRRISEQALASRKELVAAQKLAAEQQRRISEQALASRKELVAAQKLATEQQLRFSEQARSMHRQFRFTILIAGTVLAAMLTAIGAIWFYFE